MILNLQQRKLKELRIRRSHLLASVVLLAISCSEVFGALTGKPRDLITVVGSRAVFNCASDIDYAVSWTLLRIGSTRRVDIYHGSGVITSDFRGRFSVSRPSNDSYDLIVTDVRYDDAGELMCIDNSGFGLDSGEYATATLTVIDKALNCTDNIKSVNGSPDEGKSNVTLICDLTKAGRGNVGLQWTRRAPGNRENVTSATSQNTDTNIRSILTVLLTDDLDQTSFSCSVQRTSSDTDKSLLNISMWNSEIIQRKSAVKSSVGIGSLPAFVGSSLTESPNSQQGGKTSAGLIVGLIGGVILVLVGVVIICYFVVTGLKHRKYIKPTYEEQSQVGGECLLPLTCNDSGSAGQVQVSRASEQVPIAPSSDEVQSELIDVVKKGNIVNEVADSRRGGDTRTINEDDSSVNQNQPKSHPLPANLPVTNSNSCVRKLAVDDDSIVLHKPMSNTDYKGQQSVSSKINSDKYKRDDSHNEAQTDISNQGIKDENNIHIAVGGIEQSETCDKVDEVSSLRIYSNDDVMAVAVFQEYLYLLRKNQKNLMCFSSTHPYGIDVSNDININVIDEPFDIVSCKSNKCLYVSDESTRSVYKISKEILVIIQKLSIRNLTSGLLSVTVAGELIVICDYSVFVYNVYNHVCQPSRRIELPRRLGNVRQAICLYKSQYLVSFRNKSGLTLCAINENGQIVHIDVHSGCKSSQIDKRYNIHAGDDIHLVWYRSPQSFVASCGKLMLLTADLSVISLKEEVGSLIARRACVLDDMKLLVACRDGVYITSDKVTKLH